MRKVLLFITLFLTTMMGVKAAKVAWPSAESKAIEYEIRPNEVVIEVSNMGALEAFFAATDDDTKAKQDELKTAAPKKLKIKNMGGPEASAVTLSAFDIAALNVLSSYTELDLSEKVSIGLADMNGLSMSALEYLILPEGNSGAEMWNTIGKDEFKNQNPSLKMAASVTNDTEKDLPTWTNPGQQNRQATVTGTINTKKLALYSYEANSVNGFKTGHDNLFNDIDKLDMAGAYGDQDLVKDNNKVFTSNKLHYFDFTGATFAQMSNAAEFGTGWDSNFFYEQTFTYEANGKFTGGRRITETTTNSFNYFHNYIASAYTVSLPTGNTDVPAGLFKGYEPRDCGLLEVTIPEGYTRIGAEAFYWTAITSVKLPASMKDVSYGAFIYSKVVNVEMEASETTCTFKEKAFMYCEDLKHFTMGEGVTSIPNQMFQQCPNLEYIRIPSSCTDIGYWAFYLCISLHSVTIPVGVQEIKPQAFRLAALTDIYLLATNKDELPLITPQSNAEESDHGTGTFNAHQLWANHTAPSNAGTSIPANTSDVVKSFYQEGFSNGGYLGSSNCIVALHHPKELGSFLDAYDLDDPSQGTISSRYQYEDKDGKRWPSGGANDCDYIQYRVSPDGVDVNNIAPSKEAWRQFAIVNGDVINYSKVYDETWYTMCFPWHVSDTQLFEAFNQACEIVEFKGAEVINTAENEYSLMLHFDEVPEAHYIDGNNNEYKREEGPDYTITSPVRITIKTYKYTRYDENGQLTSDVVTFNTDNDADNSRYFQIQNILAVAGHPYMIHPAAVEKYDAATGSRVGTLCTIAGVKRIAKTNNELINLEKAGKVTRTATTGNAQTAFTSPLGGGGTYTFHGFLGRNYDEATDEVGTTTSDIPQYSYFLAVPDGQKYPKYYREMANPAEGKWTLYTAIITPDQDAIDNIEKLDGARVQNSANVAFGEWETVEATAIEQIIADAQERGEEVREIHMNVVYNINGQVVRTDGQIEGLPKGLYIVNGKKYMVK